MGTTIVIIIAAVIVVSVFAMLISLRMSVAQAAKRSREAKPKKPSSVSPEKTRAKQQSWAWADAVVLEAQSIPAERAAWERVSLTLEIILPEGEPYRTDAEWLIESAALHLISPGSHVPVKVSNNSQAVFPAAAWAIPVDMN